MSISSSATLIDVLREWQFLEAPQLAQLARNRLIAYANPRELARDLVHQGWLSPYQANRLIQGHGQELVLGPYRLIEPLGEGSLGRVFKARDVRMGRLVAIKIIREERVRSFRSIERLLHEATVVARLAHPNIVRSYGAGQVGNTYVFAMEHVAGLDLEALVEKKGRLPIAEACEHIRQASLGLQHAHERGVVHRNIKPRNIIVTEEGRGKAPTVKLVDFCLSLMESDTALENPAAPAQLDEVVGTIDFISPEQAAHPRAADTRSDVFSLGCTLFYLLTGRVPFAGKGLIDKILVRCRNDAPLVRTLRPEVPPGLESVIAKMLARDPEQRYPNPGDVAAALAPFVVCSASGSASLPPAAIPISPVRRPPAPTPQGPAVEPGDCTASGEDLPSSPMDLVPTELKGGKRFLVGLGALLCLAAITVAAALLGNGGKKTGRGQPQEVRLGTPVPPSATKPPAKKEKAQARPKEKVTPRSEPAAGHKASSTPAREQFRPEPKPEPVAQAKGKPAPIAKPTGRPEPKTEPKTNLDSRPATKPVAVAGKLPVPDSAAQMKAETLIKDLFKADYSRKTPADLRALAEKLFQQGLDTGDDLTARFVLFWESNDLAAQAGELEEAFKTVTILAKEYAVDVLVMKTASLATASRMAKTPPANKVVAEAALPLINDAVGSDRYDVALRLLALADVAARRSSSGALARQVETRDREAREIEMEYKVVKPALASLLSDGAPKANADPANYLAAGRFLCLMKGDWTKGLPLLAVGNNDDLVTLAKKDLAEPKLAIAQVKVGDGWWDLAETQSGVAKKQARLRACYWYKQALPDLKGLTRTRVERRIHPPRGL